MEVMSSHSNPDGSEGRSAADVAATGEAPAPTFTCCAAASNDAVEELVLPMSTALVLAAPAEAGAAARYSRAAASDSLKLRIAAGITRSKRLSQAELDAR